MIRVLLLVVLLLAFPSIPSLAQKNEFFVTDTAAVQIVFDKSLTIPDTVYKIRKAIPGEDYIIWFDHSRKQQCVHHTQEAHTTWYRNGQVNTIFQPLAKDSTSFTGWYPDGKCKIKTENRADSTILSIYYHNGRIAYKEVTHLGKFIYYEKWCDNGQLITKIHFTLAKKALITHYHCNGIKKVEYLGANGIATGKWQEWYENGMLKTEGDFPNIPDETLSEEPLPFPLETGTWKYYTENGKLEKEITYDNGKIIKEVKY